MWSNVTVEHCPHFLRISGAMCQWWAPSGGLEAPKSLRALAGSDPRVRNPGLDDTFKKCHLFHVVPRSKVDSAIES